MDVFSLGIHSQTGIQVNDTFARSYIFDYSFKDRSGDLNLGDVIGASCSSEESKCRTGRIRMGGQEGMVVLLKLGRVHLVSHASPHYLLVVVPDPIIRARMDLGFLYLSWPNSIAQNS